MGSRSFNVAVAITLILTPASIAQDPPDGRWWLEAGLKAHSILIDPSSLATHEIIEPDAHPIGVLSPDGKSVAFVGSEPNSDQPFDVFVADVDLSQPSGKANVRKLTTGQERPTSLQWVASGDGVVFLAGDATVTQVWYASIASGAGPFRISDGRFRAYSLSVHPLGDVAYLVHKRSEGKQHFKDLVVHTVSDHALKSAGGTLGRVPLRDEQIFAYAISPDGRTLAWSDAGSLHLLDLRQTSSREIPLQGVHRKLLNHAAHNIAWRPDGQVLALRCAFIGGVMEVPDGQGGFEPPRMFAQDKIFFVPVAWTPTAEEINVGKSQGDYPSPFADDPAADTSPPAADESRPWWVVGIPERVISMQWVDAETARRRVSEAPSTIP